MSRVDRMKRAVLLIVVVLTAACLEDLGEPHELRIEGATPEQESEIRDCMDFVFARKAHWAGIEEEDWETLTVVVRPAEIDNGMFDCQGTAAWGCYVSKPFADESGTYPDPPYIFLTWLGGTYNNALIHELQHHIHRINMRVDVDHESIEWRGDVRNLQVAWQQKLNTQTDRGSK